jgi:hypothetical protein
VGLGFSAHLVRLPREVVRRLDNARDAVVKIRPACVVGLVHGKGEAGVVFELEVDLAVFARLDDVFAGADFGGEVAVEV